MNIQGYQRNLAPATLLRSASGFPHAKISAAQRIRRAFCNGWSTSLRQEFNTSYTKMVDTGVPLNQVQKALKDAYKYFDALMDGNINNKFFDI